MNRYYVFSYEHYYPLGGMTDCCGRFETLEEAIACTDSQITDYREVWDVVEEKLVYSKDHK